MKKPLILDGSMGALLSQMGFYWDEKRWMTDVIMESPETVFKLHSDYIEAGANIITTHTFRTNPAAVGNKDSKVFVKKAVEIVKKACNETSAIIAGSNPPSEDCYQIQRNLLKKELEINHCNHIDLLIDNEVDFILNETQSHMDEIKIICNYCSKNEIPYIVSLYFKDDLTLLSGERLDSVIEFIKEHNPLAIGFNCITPAAFINFSYNNKFQYLWGFYLNCGAGAPTDKNIKCGISPDEYAKHAIQHLDQAPSFIGACCGSSPEHIKKLKANING
jgi:S-methylmethionine-dependent homocysteine/selenocysteine methylase